MPMKMASQPDLVGGCAKRTCSALKGIKQPGACPSLSMVFAFLSGRDLASCEECCVFWRQRMEQGGWRAACDRDWAGKVYIPEKIRNLSPRKKAYAAALLDSKRTTISFDELCDLKWSHRFKEAAGEFWTSRDAWWSGGPACTFSFNRDSTCSTNFAEEVPMSWSFERMDRSKSQSACQSEGTCIRYLWNGRECPSYIVSRHPGNWGWILQNCWNIMTSWDMPSLEDHLAHPDPDMNVEGVSVADQFTHVLAFNTGINIGEHAALISAASAAATEEDGENSVAGMNGSGSQRVPFLAS